MAIASVTGSVDGLDARLDVDSVETIVEAPPPPSPEPVLVPDEVVDHPEVPLSLNPPPLPEAPAVVDAAPELPAFRMTGIGTPVPSRDESLDLAPRMTAAVSPRGVAALPEVTAAPADGAPSAPAVTAAATTAVVSGTTTTGDLATGSTLAATSGAMLVTVSAAAPLVATLPATPAVTTYGAASVDPSIFDLPVKPLNLNLISGLSIPQPVDMSGTLADGTKYDIRADGDHYDFKVEDDDGNTTYLTTKGLAAGRDGVNQLYQQYLNKGGDFWAQTADLRSVVIGQGFYDYAKLDPARNGLQTLVGSNPNAQQVLANAGNGFDLIVGQTVADNLVNQKTGTPGVYTDSQAFADCRNSILNACSVNPSGTNLGQTVVPSVVSSLTTLQDKATTFRNLFKIDPTTFTPDKSFLTTPFDDSVLPKADPRTGPNLTPDMIPPVIALFKPLDANTNLAYRMKMMPLPPGGDSSTDTGPSAYFRARINAVHQMNQGTQVIQHNAMTGLEVPLNNSPYLSRRPWADAIQSFFARGGQNPTALEDSPPGDPVFFPTTYGPTDKAKQLAFWSFDTNKVSGVSTGMVQLELAQTSMQAVLKEYST